MAVADVIKREGQAVFVEVKNKQQLKAFPKALKGDLTGMYKNPYPYVLFADPALKKVYGAFHHNQLKSKDFRGLFRDTKKQIREAIKAGDFLAAEPPVNEKYDVKPEVATASEVVQISDKTVYDWKSAQGTTIRARLISVSEEEFVFQSEEGREIRATAEQLAAETVEKARSLASKE